MNSIRALIIDDSSVMRKIVERSLRQAGIELTKVFEAGNGAEALGVLKVNQVDLILCDINMPVMDGLEATSRNRECERRACGYDHDRGQRDARGAGPIVRRPRLYPQAVHPGAGSGTGYARAGRQTVKAMNELPPADSSHKELASDSWLRIMLDAVAQGNQEDGALTFGMWREKADHIIVVKCETSSSQALGISG